jgi:YrbI family 3-deoxy-D-manno-octulosonate 8-phosphate phosphatase
MHPRRLPTRPSIDPTSGKRSAERKARDVRLLFVDVDGVMTDGRIVLTGTEEETKFFDVKDGLGVRMLLEQGIQVVLVTGRRSEVVERRARELGIYKVHQDVRNKGALCRRIRREMGLKRGETAAIGDDLPDLAMFLETGLRIAVGDAAAELVACADKVTLGQGGRGALREACEWILKCQGKWPDLMRKFRTKSTLQGKDRADKMILTS